jgi:uncharacterized protein YjdB
MLRRIVGVALLLLTLAACGVTTTPLELTSLTPSDGATGVPVDAVLEAVFDQDIDESTLTGAFALTGPGGDVAGTVAYDAANRAATFTPDADLAFDTTYTATIAGSVATAGGDTLDGDATWSFTTQSQQIGGIDVTPASPGIQVGDTVQLSADATGVVGSPDTSVTWTSSDDSVATVDAAGLVTGVAEGTATITATSVFDTSVSGSATVTVSVADAIGGIEVSPATATVDEGDTEQLTATLTGVVGSPDEGVSWSSSDDSVATVDGDGLVTAVGVGTATITASSDFDGGLTDSAEITVPGIGGIDVTPDAPDPISADGTTTVQLSADATGVVGSPDTSVTWASADEAIATVDASGLVTAVAPGTVTITATSVIDTGLSDSVDVTVAEPLAGSDYLLNVDAGEPVDLAPSLTGGAAPFSYAISDSPETGLTINGLPPGLVLDETTGAITGTPTAAGFFREAIDVTDASGQTIEVLAEITVAFVFEYASTTYTYDPAATGTVVVPAGDVTTLGTVGVLEFSLTLTDPVAEAPGPFTIDAATGAITLDSAPGATTSWTYEVGVCDDGQDPCVVPGTVTDTFEITLEEAVP